MPIVPFSARYAGYSDEQLLEIVYQTQDYVPDAVLDMSAGIHFLRREVRLAYRTSDLPMAWIFFGAVACLAIHGLSKLA